MTTLFVYALDALPMLVTCRKVMSPTCWKSLTYLVSVPKIWLDSFMSNKTWITKSAHGERLHCYLILSPVLSFKEEKLHCFMTITPLWEMAWPTLDDHKAKHTWAIIQWFWLPGWEIAVVAGGVSVARLIYFSLQSCNRSNTGTEEGDSSILETYTSTGIRIQHNHLAEGASWTHALFAQVLFLPKALTCQTLYKNYTDKFKYARSILTWWSIAVVNVCFPILSIFYHSVNRKVLVFWFFCHELLLARRIPPLFCTCLMVTQVHWCFCHTVIIPLYFVKYTRNTAYLLGWKIFTNSKCS